MKKDYYIELAGPSDHEQLSEIAIESKRYWEYPEEWIRGWLEELTIQASYLQSQHTHVYKLTRRSDNLICGFCALEWDSLTEEIEIAHLWIKPEFIGMNLGKLLLKISLDRVAYLGAKKITTIADPNATGFYEKFGFKTISHIESTPAGRLLPKMVLEMS